ncbi:MAG: hypothetical protein FLDDKLPJ_01355 [Phycisphaerae bacterium]|nr:hypothetical protein [Phycisphaerae bacterium]
MMRHNKARAFVALGLALLTSAARATDYTWTAGGDGHSWTDTSNWSPSGYPQSSADTAVIPANFNGDDDHYPIFNDSTARTIKSFKVLNGSNAANRTVLEIEEQSSSRILKILDRDGLDPGQGRIELNRGSELWLLGGGVLPLLNTFTFDSDNAASDAERPQLVLGDGSVLYISTGSSASLTSKKLRGGVIRGQITSPDKDETLVLHPDLSGSFAIDVALAHIGAITTFVSGQTNLDHTIRFSCLPKTGTGDVNVTPAPSSSNLATFVWDAPYLAMGLIDIGEHGESVATGNRHVVTFGGTNVRSGSKLEVKTRILYEAGGIAPECFDSEEP